MPQDVERARDDGKIRMPPTDGAMNKISPAFKTDDKGTALGAPKGEKAKQEKLLERVRKRMDRAISAESENRKAGMDDRSFVAGNQWPSEVVAQRALDKRPCLTFNKFPTLISQITNAQRQSRPSINISATGERGDVEVAKMYRGMIRFIERDCGANSPNGPYDTAFADAVTMGWGYWRVLTEWESPKSFNLVLVVRRIRNPFTVYLDPTAQEIDGADAKWGIVSEMIPRDEFKEKYPKADQMPFTQAGLGETMKQWISNDEIRVAEYFEIEYKTRTLVELSNGHIGWEDELDEITHGYIDRGRITVTDERESRVPQVMWYKLTAKDVLMEREWLGSTIPIVKVTGRELDIEGKPKLKGIVRDAKDAQRMINYWDTSKTEMVALAPKSPYIGEEGQFEGHEDEWKMSNVRSTPYLSYKGTSVGGTPAPPPQRVPFAGVPAGIVEASQSAQQHLMGITGIRFDATMNERTMDESGKALRELRQSGDIGSFDFIDNLTQSLRRTGEIMLELIPKIYSDARVITIIREDDQEEQVRLDPAQPKAIGEIKRPDGKKMKTFNPIVGKYGVTVTIGPNFATKRIEAGENMIAFAKALPQTAALIADLIAKNMDWPGAEEIASRLAKTLPPNLLVPDQKDLSPQVQALLSSMDQQIKQLTQQLQQAMAALQDKNADRAVIADKVNKDFEAKLLKIVADIEAKMAATEQAATANFNTHIGAQIRELGTDTTALMQQLEHPAAAADASGGGDGAAAGGGDGAAAGGGDGAAAGGGDGAAAAAGPARSAAAAGGEASPAGGGAAPEGQPPPEALRHLKPGRNTTFGNGQTWTMGADGKPQRVPGNG